MHAAAWHVGLTSAYCAAIWNTRELLPHPPFKLQKTWEVAGMVGVSAASEAQHAALRPPQHQLSTRVASEALRGGASRQCDGRQG